MKNVLLLSGGGGSEHEISLISAKYIQGKIDTSLFNVISVELSKSLQWELNGEPCELNFQKQLICGNQKLKIDCVIPCLHGYPGETGDIQSYLKFLGLPFFGCNAETSTLCFNKLTTKLWLEMYGVKTTPFIAINEPSEFEFLKAETFLDQHKSVFIKATNQGSSVGCYKVNKISELRHSISEAFSYSPFVMIEKDIKGRELEVAVFEYNDDLIVSEPGEIICPDEFYTYEEKYNSNSETKTKIVANNISKKQLDTIQKQAKTAFKVLKLRHLSRIDFFLSNEGDILINEINTFPGHTSISMFPSMMENTGVSYSDFINSRLKELS